MLIVFIYKLAYNKFKKAMQYLTRVIFNVTSAMTSLNKNRPVAQEQATPDKLFAEKKSSLFNYVWSCIVSSKKRSSCPEWRVLGTRLKETREITGICVLSAAPERTTLKNDLVGLAENCFHLKVITQYDGENLAHAVSRNEI